MATTDGRKTQPPPGGQRHQPLPSSPFAHLTVSIRHAEKLSQHIFADYRERLRLISPPGPSLVPSGITWRQGLATLAMQYAYASVLASAADDDGIQDSVELGMRYAVARGGRFPDPEWLRQYRASTTSEACNQCGQPAQYLAGSGYACRICMTEGVCLACGERLIFNDVSGLYRCPATI